MPLEKPATEESRHGVCCEVLLSVLVCIRHHVYIFRDYGLVLTQASGRPGRLPAVLSWAAVTDPRDINSNGALR